MSNLPGIAFGVECNTPHKELDAVIQGIRNLADCRPVTSIAVGTEPGTEEVFVELLRVCREAGKLLIPGIKFSPLLKGGKRFDNIGSWGELADSVVRLCHYAESGTVVVGIESASRNYVNGSPDYEIDMANLVRGIRQLPVGINTWFYPSLTYIPEDTGAPLSHGRQMNIVRSLLMGHSRTGFIDTSIGIPSGYHDQRVIENERKLRALYQEYCPGVKRYVMRKMWFFGPGTTTWSDDEGVAAIAGAVKSPDGALIYTGYKRWVEGTATLARLLNLWAGREE